MHVLFLVEDYPAPGEVIGGVRMSVRRLANGLAARHRVTIVTLELWHPPLPRYAARRRRPAPDPQSSAARAPRILRYRYLHVPVLWPLTQPLQTLALAIWAFLRHARDAEVVHGHWAYPPGLTATLLGRLTRRRSVVTVYGSDIHQLARGGRRALRVWIGLTLRLAARVIAVSQSLIHAITALGVGEQRRAYVPSGVDLTRFAPPDDLSGLRARLGLPAGRRVLLCTSTFTHVKGHRVLIEAFEMLRERRADCFLVMTSDGPLRAQIATSVREAGLESHVRLTGVLDAAAMPDWVAAADVLVMPSLAEGMPLAVLECFACAKPLVGSRVGGIPELVIDGTHGLLVPPGDAPALAAAIEQALDHPWNREALRARARAFDWPRVVEQLEAVYTATTS